MIVQNKKIFRWGQRNSWEPVFRRLLAGKINDAVIAEIQRINPQHLSDDTFEWLNTAVATITNQPLEQIPVILQAGFSKHYRFIIAFHGTRSESAYDFLNHGIKLSDTKSLEQLAIKRHGNGDAVQGAIIELRQFGYERHNHGRIYLCLTKEACLRDHPHYMLEGSEYLAAIANRVQQSASPAPTGKPLIIECLVPTSSLDSESEFWRGRSYAMLEDYFTRLLRPSERRRVRPSCAVTIQPIAAKNILRVHEFVEIRRKFQWDDFDTGKRQESENVLLRPRKIWDQRTNV